MVEVVLPAQTFDEEKWHDLFFGRIYEAFQNILHEIYDILILLTYR